MEIFRALQSKRRKTVVADRDLHAAVAAKQICDVIGNSVASAYLESFKIRNAPRITKAKTIPPTIRSGHLLDNK